MATANINRKSAQSQGDTWQDTLRDYKSQMMTDKQQQVAPERDKTISAYKVKPDSDRKPQKSTGVKINASEPPQTKPKQTPERVRPEGMTRVQWKNLKNRHRVLAFWPELFNTDNPKPLKTGVLNDLIQDIAVRGLTISEGTLKRAVATYTHRIRYKKAIAAGGVRYDLNGQPCGEVTPEQQQEAAEELEKPKNTM